jgi:hypothetical protein
MVNMIKESDVVWKFIPLKVELTDLTNYSNVIINVIGNFSGQLGENIGVTDFQTRLSQPTDSFIDFDNLTTDILVSFVETSIDSKILNQLKTQVLTELSALTNQEYVPLVRVIDWS